VEILHTVSLGQFRYLWFATTNKWNEEKEEKCVAWLGTRNVDGLAGVPSGVQARYLIDYKNNLVGKNFKWISQLMAFSLHWGGCDPIVFDLWKATGELGTLVWCTKILDVDQYVVRMTTSQRNLQLAHENAKTPPQADVEIAVSNVLDIWVKIDPNRIITKLKLHVLTHLRDDVRRFGPPALYEVEVFEASNQVFRQCSVLSNHHAPSRDIATTMARMERFKHIISGGWWWNEATKSPAQAGKHIVKDFGSNKFLQSHLGWTPDQQHSPGTHCPFHALVNSPFVDTIGLVVPVPKQSQPSDCTWDLLFSGLPPARPRGVDEETRFKLGESVISRSGDVCCEGSWVFYNTHNVRLNATALDFHSPVTSDRFCLKACPRL
jgi:hypothetical protein